MKHSYRFRRMLTGLVTSLLLVAGNHANARRRAWQTMPYPCRILTQEARVTFEDFGENVGVPTEIAPDVHGTLQNLSSNGNALDFLNRLTRTLDVDWYDNGASIFITLHSDERDVRLNLGSATYASLKSQLADAGALDDRYLLEPGSGGTVTVAGPPAYIAAVRDRITALNPGTGPADAHRVTVYRGVQQSTVRIP